VLHRLLSTSGSYPQRQDSLEAAITACCRTPAESPSTRNNSQRSGFRSGTVGQACGKTTPLSTLLTLNPTPGPSLRPPWPAPPGPLGDDILGFPGVFLQYSFRALLQPWNRTTPLTHYFPAALASSDPRNCGSGTLDRNDRTQPHGNHRLRSSTFPFQKARLSP